MNAIIRQQVDDGVFLLEEAILTILENPASQPCISASQISLKSGLNDDATTPAVDLITFSIFEILRHQGRVDICDTPECGGWKLTKSEAQRRAEPIQLREDLDWEADLTVQEHQQLGDITVRDLDWGMALHHHGPSIQEALENPELRYTTKIDNHLDAAYAFDFTESKTQITAHGKLHPAQLFPDGTHQVDENTTIAAAKIAITFRSVHTREAVRRYIAQHG